MVLQLINKKYQPISEENENLVKIYKAEVIIYIMEILMDLRKL